MKKIKNIVFYKFNGEQGVMQQACIFYENGEVSNVSYEEGLSLVEVFAKQENITSREELNKIVNKRNLFFMSGAEFEKRFKEFLNNPYVPAKSAQTTKAPIVFQPKDKVIVREPIARAASTRDNSNNGKQAVTPKVVSGKGSQQYSVRKENIVDGTTVIPKAGKGANTTRNAQPTNGTTRSAQPTNGTTRTTQSTNSAPKAAPANGTTNNNAAASAAVAPSQAEKAVAKNTKKKKKNIFARAWDRLKKTKVVTRVVAGVLALTMMFGAGWHLSKAKKSGSIINNNIITQGNYDTSTGKVQPQDLAFLKLIKETKNDTQRDLMQKQSNRLDSFNRDFASHYIEAGKDVKAALTWDEMIALTLAYNDFSKEEIAIMFNGSEVNANALTNAYKNATLQLMGAYVIETRENPVNSAAFVNSEAGKAFVEKYNDLFLRCKETTGAEQVAAIDAFYAELYKDFPITSDVREIGISHADGRDLIAPYKLAVTPMVAAAEMMFQNIGEIDHTMSDAAIAYFNDLGLCNVAQKSFERAETITISTPTNPKLGLYEDYKETKIQELIAEGNYVTTDARRDLTQLDEFQKWVNYGGITYTTYTTTTTTRRTVTETETRHEQERTETSDRNEAVEQAGEEAVREAEQAVDREIERQNEEARRQAEEAAERERQRLQAEADRQRQEQEQQVRQDQQDMQQDIADANQTITTGGTVNENDFGDHNVHFDDQHSDGNGNLNPSVENITTDGTGDQTGMPLPDPNETGAIFDASSARTAFVDGDMDTILNQYIESLATNEYESHGQYVR